MNGTLAVAPLPAARLARRADLSAITFATTADLAPIGLPVGQERALDAVRFGARIGHAGFNLFVIGSPGSDMDRTVKAMLEAKGRDEPVPPDWVYVHNFAAPQKPRAMQLPPGRGPQFRDAIRDLIKDLEVALPAAFESQEYQARRGAIDESFRRKQEEAFGALTREAAERSVAVVRTPFGFGIAPLKDGEVLKPELFNALPEEERSRVQATLQEFEKRLEDILHSIPRWDKQRRDEIRALNRDTARFAVGHSIDETQTRFTDLPQVLEHLDAMRADLLDNVGAFIAPAQAGDGEGEEEWATTGPLDRYEVNVLVTHPADAPGAPVVEELHPTLGNLVGRIEHEWHRGVMVTSFRRLKPGALHQANGGYLLLDVRSVLIEPFSWLALKRALRSQQIRIERIDDLLGLTTTVSLEPDPIPLDVKVVLHGERLLYYLLAEYDPELAEHFKVLADFEDSFDRGATNEAAYARLVASIAQQAKLRPFDRAAVERVIERASRLADDAAKLSLRVDPLRDLLTESDFWAGEAGRAVVGAADVERAIAEQIRRASRLRERMLESTLREIALIDTSGRRVGQLNGLSVLELGGYAFGRPSRISARVRPGAGKLVDIEREVALGGPIHAKGVLILAGFLGGRYALDVPLSLHASLVFEQSYGGVEGDSASTAELCALLSALAELPLRQDLALTGSVNQAGEVQAIGGVNEKIEGFFDLCAARGLTGTQGVLIPVANVQHLMLRADVIEACAAGCFAVWPVRTVDEAIALLTGVAAGERAADGAFASDSVNARVEARLREFARVRPPPRGEEATS
ncbi:MAG: ATP-dependent protease [Betaproteobacteria bacterium]|nr:MAG: ATP-dependent protease [Betaproteobacteria bacterium]